MNSHSVYIIEILPHWYDLVAPDLLEGKQCFYVGQTGKRLTERFWEHRTGRRKDRSKGDASARVFRRMRAHKDGKSLSRIRDVRLRRTMTKHIGLVDEETSLDWEIHFIDKLRAQGHAVYPKKQGNLPFEGYARET